MHSICIPVNRYKIKDQATDGRFDVRQDQFFYLWIYSNILFFSCLNWFGEVADGKVLTN